MRLTLRTMLAYLDNVLDPADAEDLGRKINESDFASGLVQRTKGVLKKLRMDAPKLDGKGIGNDANTVSEYLDSTLPQDRVGDFERVCLESDKHLCEVASCHQILALVLGKPADVSPELRERVYSLGHPERMPPQVQPPVTTASAAPPVVAPPPVLKANGQPAVKAALVVPEYLRQGRGTPLWPIVATLAATLLIALGVLWAAGMLQSGSRLRRLFGGPQQVALSTSPESSPAPAKATDAPTEPTPAPGELSDSAPPVEPTPPVEAVASTSVPPAPSTEPPTSPIPLVATENSTAVADTKPGEPAPPPTSPPPSPDLVATVTPAPPAPIKPDPPPATPAAEPAQHIEVGRYTSDGQVLATLAGDALWRRKPPMAVLAAGERLLVLPPYRPQIALPSGVQVTFAGEGAVQMERAGETGASRMTVEYGRFLAVTVGAAKAQLDLDLAGIKGTITLVDADSSLAVKVSRWLPPGFDPEAAPGMPVIELFNTGGRLTWQEVGKDKVEVAPRHVHYYIGVEPPDTLGPFQAPEWIDAKSVPPIDREAATKLEGLLDVAKPLNVSLQELMQDRRVEIRALTARCLAALGEFEPILRELNDPRQNAYWPGEVEILKQSLYRGTDTAAQLRTALERLRGREAADLYRLLWGYSQEQLASDADATLVRYLEHDQMDIRVLAFYNLVSITGAQEFYRPDRPPSSLPAAIRNWKERRDKGTISYKSQPSPLETYKPLAPPPGAAPSAEPRRTAPAPATP